MNKTNKSHSSLFLIELMIVLVFFALASTVCIQLFVQSHLLSQSTAEQNEAILLAESMAEEFRAADGDISAKDVYYDKNWSVCSREEAAYTREVALRTEHNMKVADISVYGGDLQSPIYTLEVKICP